MGGLPSLFMIRRDYMNAFAKTHPLVQSAFYLFSLVIVIAFNNPFISAVSLFSAIVYSLFTKKAMKNIAFSFIVIAVVALFNFTFAHYGNNVLFKISETPFTLNALFYGLNQGAVVAATLLWFTAFGRGMDSEKLLYMFRFTPKLALMFSMILGFIPRFLDKGRDIREAQAALCGGEEKKKITASINVFSALITYSLESSIITADSMKARSYNPKAQRAGRYKFSAGEAVMLLTVILLGSFVVFQKAIGNLSFVFDPDIYILKLSIPALICFFILEIMPCALELTENIRWKKSFAKI